MTLDLGGTTAELLHLGRGHTDNDLLVHLPASGVWLTGDLVEESGPPVYGSGSFPLDWPATIGRLRAEAGDRWPFPEGLPGAGLAAAARDGYAALARAATRPGTPQR